MALWIIVANKAKLSQVWQRQCGIVRSTICYDYRFGCWLTGTAMVAIAIVCSLRSGRKPDGES